MTKKIDYSNFDEVNTELLQIIHSENRVLYQFILSDNSVRGFISHFTDQNIVACPEFKEKLFLNTSELNSKQKISSALKNIRAKEFHSLYLKVYTVPFCLFFESFSNILKEEGLDVSFGIRKSIREAIDVNKNYFIDAEEISMFFDSWENPDEREVIINRGLVNEKKSQNDKLGYKLILLVEESFPDPVTHCTSFNRGDTFEIDFEGYKPSKRFCADRTVYFGKENAQFKNDVEFNSADTQVSVSHFSIHSKKSGFFIVDNSGNLGVKLKVFEIPVLLFEEAVIVIAEHEIRVNTCASPLAAQDNIISLEFKGKPTSDPTEPRLELEVLSEALFGLRTSADGKKLIKIGSASDNDLVLHGASPYHAIIELRPGG